MARVVTGFRMSLDGYVADPNGDFSWAEPDEVVHAAVNDTSRGMGTQLYGRRMYEVVAEARPKEPVSGLT